MKAMLLMLGALSAAIIFAGCGTAVGRATGVESSEAEQVLAENERAEYVEETCKTQLIMSNSKQAGKATKETITDPNAFMEECLKGEEFFLTIAAEFAPEGDMGTDVDKAVEEAKQEMEIVKAGAEEVFEGRAMMADIQATCLKGSRSANSRKGKSVSHFMHECMTKGSAELAVVGDIDSDVDEAVEVAKQEMEIVKAGAEEVFEERVSSLEEKVAELIELLKAQ
jgi:hypothetical protein